MCFHINEFFFIFVVFESFKFVGNDRKSILLLLFFSGELLRSKITYNIQCIQFGSK